MQFKTFDVFEMLESSGVNVHELRAEHSDRSPQFFSYHIGGIEGFSGEIIEVESTARSVMAEIVCLPLEVQKTVFTAIVRILPRPGEQTILVGDGKKRGARVVRLASPEDNSNIQRLLLTH